MSPYQGIRTPLELTSLLHVGVLVRHLILFFYVFWGVALFLVTVWFPYHTELLKTH
jgi:hypothetical protein